jgi:hypothetical protein
MESTPREARREIRDHLPDLVYQYLRYIRRRRAWVTSTEILQHFNLGKRESLVVQELREMKARGPKELLKPENLIRTPIFVLETRERWNSRTQTNFREFLVERNLYYRPHYRPATPRSTVRRTSPEH